MWNHRRSDRRQVENIAAVQRQFVSLALIDDRAQRRSFCLQQRRLRGYFHNLAHFANLESGIDASALLHVDRDIGSHEVLESLLLHINPVLAGKQVHKGEEAVAAAGFGALFRRAQVCQRHFGVRNRGSGIIGDRSSDRSVGALTVEVNGGRNS